MRTLIALVVLLSAAPAPSLVAADREVAKKEPLTLMLSASFASEPGEVAVRMRLEPDPRLRSLSVEWWTDDMVGGSHDISLDGDRTATRVNYPIKGIEAGEYTVSVTLRRDDGSSVKRAARLVVIGRR